VQPVPGTDARWLVYTRGRKPAADGDICEILAQTGLVLGGTCGCKWRGALANRVSIAVSCCRSAYDVETPILSGVGQKTKRQRTQGPRLNSGALLHPQARGQPGPFGANLQRARSTLADWNLSSATLGLRRANLPSEKVLRTWTTRELDHDRLPPQCKNFAAPHFSQKLQLAARIRPCPKLDTQYPHVGTQCRRLCESFVPHWRSRARGVPFSTFYVKELNGMRKHQNSKRGCYSRSKPVRARSWGRVHNFRAS
jgi:hypothetical protein